MGESTSHERDLREDLRADRAANRGNTKGRLVVSAYRIGRHLQTSGSLLAAPVAIAYRIIVDWVMGIEIPLTVESGPGLSVWHGTGLVLHRDSVLGSEVVLRHGVTLGTTTDDDSGRPPTLGDRVSVGTGAILLGPITIGDDAVIGAGAVVVRDVPAGATVVGNPGRILPAKAAGESANGVAPSSIRTTEPT